MRKCRFANSKIEEHLKKYNAFTLIELLAIIVILAIIVVITVPIILGIIDNSKKGTAIDSAYGYKDAVNKWYVEKLFEDKSFKLNDNYKVEDGKLNNQEISISGTKPTSGYLNYSNNVLTEGCLTFGEYKVAFKNGEVTKTEKGECNISILYYTYDDEATRDELGLKNSEKKSEPDASWLYYIKETETEDISSYAIVYDEEVIGQFDFDTEEECNTYMVSLYGTELIEQYNLRCSETNYKRIEACGIENGKEFCIKNTDLSNFEKIQNNLNKVFSNCALSANNRYYNCIGSSSAVSVEKNYQAKVGVMTGNNSYCVITAGFGGCTKY